MNNPRILAALLLALPLAATAQTSPATTPPPAGTQVTETTEDLDPATGKVIRRTTRTYTVPGGTATPSVAGRATTPAAMPSRTTTTTSSGSSTGSSTTASTEPDNVQATNAQISTFLGRKTALASMTGPMLVDGYNRFLDKVRNDRHNWKPSDWSLASSVLSALNARYEQLRGNMSFDDKLNIRTLQAEFHALRTGRQLTDQVSDKL